MSRGGASDTAIRFDGECNTRIGGLQVDWHEIRWICACKGLLGQWLVSPSWSYWWWVHISPIGCFPMIPLNIAEMDKSMPETEDAVCSWYGCWSRECGLLSWQFYSLYFLEVSFSKLWSNIRLPIQKVHQIIWVIAKKRCVLLSNCDGSDRFFGFQVFRCMALTVKQNSK